MVVQPQLVECTVCRRPDVAADAPSCPSCGTTDPAIVKGLAKTLAALEAETGMRGNSAVTEAKKRLENEKSVSSQREETRRIEIAKKEGAKQKTSNRFAWVSFACFGLFILSVYRISTSEPFEFRDLWVAGFSLIGFVIFYFLSALFSTAESG